MKLYRSPAERLSAEYMLAWERAIVGAFEDRIGHVPTDQQVIRNAREHIHPDGRRDLFWAEQLILTFPSPLSWAAEHL